MELAVKAFIVGLGDNQCLRLAILANLYHIIL